MSTYIRHHLSHTGTKGVIAFDLDDTLTSKSSVLPLAGVVSKLQRLHKNGYNIVVFSNQKKSGQGGIGDPKLEIKLTKAMEELKVPISIYCARTEDGYRKPGIKMIELVPIEIGKIHRFIGDAAGRPGDHSDCDLQFAKEANIPFQVPEEYFPLGIVVPRDIKPQTLQVNEVGISFLNLVIVIGYPGSGKSTYCKKTLSEYTRISRDELKTMPKCLKTCEESLKKDQNVVIDNLNNTISARENFIVLGQKYHANIVAVHVATSRGISMNWNEKRVSPVSKIVYYKYAKDFEAPTKEEGFHDIYTVL